MLKLAQRTLVPKTATTIMTEMGSQGRRRVSSVTMHGVSDSLADLIVEENVRNKKMAVACLDLPGRPDLSEILQRVASRHFLNLTLTNTFCVVLVHKLPKFSEF
jgi:hypothetical protein